MKKYFSILAGLSLFASPLAYASETPYPDLDTYYDNFEAVQNMKSTGVFSGYPDGTFQGSSTINRAELAKVVVLSAFAEEEVAACAEDATKTFSDVEETWYTDYVYCAQAQGWVNGDEGATTFRPADNVNNVEGFKMVTEATLGTPPTEFEGSNWYDLYANYLIDLDLLEDLIGADYFYFTYIGDDIGAVMEPMTRGNVAELLYRTGIHYPGLVPLVAQNAGYYEERDGEYYFEGTEDGFYFEHGPLEGFSPEDVQIFVHNYSGAESAYYTSYEFYYPSVDSPKANGLSSLFSIDIYSPEYADWDEDADLGNFLETSSGTWVTFSCPQEVSSELEDLRSSACLDGLEGLGLGLL